MRSCTTGRFFDKSFRLEIHNLYNFGKAEDQIGRLYQEDLETDVCECVVVSCTRNKPSRRPFLTPTEIQDKNPRLILGFIKASN